MTKKMYIQDIVKSAHDTDGHADIRSRVDAVIRVLDLTPKYIMYINEGYHDAETHKEVHSLSQCFHSDPANEHSSYNPRGLELMQLDKMYYHPLSPDFKILGSDYQKMISDESFRPQYAKYAPKRNESYFATLTKIGDTSVIEKVSERPRDDLYIIGNTSKRCMRVCLNAFDADDSLKSIHSTIFDKEEIYRWHAKSYCPMYTLNRVYHQYLADEFNNFRP